MDAHLDLGPIHVVLDLAALDLAHIVNGHLLEGIARRVVRQPVANQQVLASGRSRQERRQHQRAAPHKVEYPLHSAILSRGGPRGLSSGDCIVGLHEDWPRQAAGGASEPRRESGQVNARRKTF